MTLIGKLLVLLTVALSVTMAFWAFGVYTQRIEWAGKVSGAAAHDELTKRRERIKPQQSTGYGLQDSVAAAEARWKVSAQNLTGIEPLRAQNKKWYGEQLTLLVKGPGPVKTADYKDGRLVFDPNTIRPVLVDAKDKAGQPLQNRDFYVDKYNERKDQIATAMDEIGKWMKPEVWEALPKRDGRIDVDEAVKQIKPGDLAGLLITDADVTQEITRLRVLLVQEQDKRARVLAEIEYLKPQLVNSAVESELLEKRQASLKARIEELKAVGVAAR
jgi:hypothetical protein